MIRAGIYARISSDRDGDNLAISRQLADCEQLAEQKGWQVVERYVDADISAYSGKPRPEYARMLEEIEAGVVGAILVYHADRLHRHPRAGGLHRPLPAPAGTARHRDRRRRPLDPRRSADCQDPGRSGQEGER